MAYTNVWTNNVPLGTDPANTIDDQIRRLRLDIQERMASLVGNWSADPVSLFTANGIIKRITSELTVAVVNAAGTTYATVTFGGGLFDIATHILIGFRYRVKEPSGAAAYPDRWGHITLRPPVGVVNLNGVQSNNANLSIAAYHIRIEKGTVLPGESNVIVDYYVGNTGGGTSCKIESEAIMLKFA